MRTKFSIFPRTDIVSLEIGLKRAAAFESAGFDALWEADHYLPEVHSGGHVGDVAIMLDEYLNSTRKIAVGPMVVCPVGLRTQPGDIVLRYATMALFHPGRVSICLGAGCAEIEKACTGLLPPLKERHERLAEAANFIRKCLTSKEYVSFNGKYFNSLFFLYDKPSIPIPIYIAASGRKSARLAGRLGDGFVGLGSPAHFKDTLIPEFEKGVSEENRTLPQAEKMAFIPISYHPNRTKAFEIPRRMYGYLYLYYDTEIDPRIMEEKSKVVDDDTLERDFCIASTADDLIAFFEKYVKAGVNHIVCYDVSDPNLNLAWIFRQEIFPHFNS
jgi:coenzyme F420-dependent glucose-6-phosphate dehydrogenase